MSTFEHLVMRTPNSLLSGKTLKYDAVRDFAHQAASNTRTLHKHLVTKTTQLDKMYAELDRLQRQNQNLVRKRTDTSLLDSLETELAEVKAAAATERDDLNEQIKIRGMKIHTYCKDKATLQEKNGILQEEKNLLQKRVDILESENVVLRSQVDALNAASKAFIKSESVSQAQVQIEIESLKADKLVLEMKNKTLVLEHVNLRTANMQLLREINLVNNKCDKLSNIQATSNGIVWEQRGQLKALKVKLQVLENGNFENILTQNKLTFPCCPITQDVITDPVIAEDHVTYSKVGLEGLISATAVSGHILKSPMTRLAMGATYFPNYALQALLDELKRFPAHLIAQALSVEAGGKMPCP